MNLHYTLNRRNGKRRKRRRRQRQRRNGKGRTDTLVCVRVVWRSEKMAGVT